MLSRHAEHLFWIGRYLERAEDTARLLDVTQQSALETGAGRSEEEIWSELLEVLFLEDVFDDRPSPGAVHRFLVADPDNPSSILSIVGHARENTRAAREWVSAEYWEGINSLYLEMREADLERELAETPYDLLRRVKTGCQALTGIADSSLPRTEGYHFYILGGAIERALLTIRVLSVWQRRLGGFSGPAAYPEWVKLLKSLSGFEAYLRQFRAAMRADRVLEFLLQAQQFPRSLFYCIELAERQLEAIHTDPVGRVSLRSIGRLCADLEFAEPSELPPEELSKALARFHDDLVELPALIQDDYFRIRSDGSRHSYEAF